MDTDQFIAAYVQDVATMVADVVEPAKFVEHLLAGTAAMLAERPERMRTSRRSCRRFSVAAGTTKM